MPQAVPAPRLRIAQVGAAASYPVDKQALCPGWRSGAESDLGAAHARS
jgi:hypothetical protein